MWEDIYSAANINIMAKKLLSIIKSPTFTIEFLMAFSFSFATVSLTFPFVINSIEN